MRAFLPCSIVLGALVACGSNSGGDAPSSFVPLAPDSPGNVPPATVPPAAVPPAAMSPVTATPSPSEPTNGEAPSAGTTPVSTETPPSMIEPPEMEPADDPPATMPPDMPEPTEAVGPEPNAGDLARCSGTDPISCHFGGAPGNYSVTVILGGEAPARTAVFAEAKRAMLPSIVTAAGESRRFTFNVNVRQPEGQPIQAVPPGIAGLDVYFQGSAGQAPALRGIGIAPAPTPFAVYVAGDSTVCDQEGADYGGWAQQLPQFFDYPVVIANYADSGESSGSFLNARPLFATVEEQLRPNDWVFIQFGHNDKTVTGQQFHDNLTAMVQRVKAKGASPLLFSPVARALFEGARVAPQHINETGANLPEIVRQVSVDQGVPMLDLTARTAQWLAEVGPQGWQPFHALGTDATHTNDAGALVEAEFVREMLRNAALSPLVDLMR